MGCGPVATSHCSVRVSPTGFPSCSSCKSCQKSSFPSAQTAYSRLSLVQILFIPLILSRIPAPLKHQKISANSSYPFPGFLFVRRGTISNENKPEFGTSALYSQDLGSTRALAPSRRRSRSGGAGACSRRRLADGFDVRTPDNVLQAAGAATAAGARLRRGAASSTRGACARQGDG